MENSKKNQSKMVKQIIADCQKKEVRFKTSLFFFFFQKVISKSNDGFE